MINEPNFAGIEAALLELVSEETGESIADLRAEEDRCPSDPPWDSRAFVNLQFVIEERFGIEFTDILAAERASRRLDTMVSHILALIRARAAETA